MDARDFHKKILQMYSQQPIKKVFKHLFSIQNDVIFFYERLAYITTEKDLKRIFSALADFHKDSKKSIEQQFFSNKNDMQTYLERGHSFFYEKWKVVLGAVLVNNRKELIGYCKKSELKLLEEIQILIHLNENKLELVEILSSYENQLLTYLNKLNHLSYKNISHNRAA